MNIRSLRQAAALLVLGATCTAMPAAEPGRLSDRDYIEIEQLVHKLHFALDYCTRGGAAFADLFVEGGAFTIDQGDGKPRVYSTREQLVQLAGGPDCEVIRHPPRSYVLHAAENLVIEPTATGASGLSYAIYPARAGKYFGEEFAGQVGLYRDEYVRTRDGWRFRSRIHDVPGTSLDASP
jgi:hypothetical protein